MLVNVPDRAKAAVPKEQPYSFLGKPGDPLWVLPQAVIGKHVLRALGEPGNLLRVEVRRLWADHYRANVLVGASDVSVKVATEWAAVARESCRMASPAKRGQPAFTK